MEQVVGALWGVTGSGMPEPFRSRLVPANTGAAEIRRIGWLTPESVQSLLDDSRLCGRGARLEIRLSSKTPAEGREWLASLTSRLRRRGISVEVIDESAGGAGVAREFRPRDASRRRRAASELGVLGGVAS